MHANEELLHSFYQAFQKRDAKTMGEIYSDKATFNDPAFNTLNAAQVRGMWSMLLGSPTDLSFTYQNVKADDKTGSAEWIAKYTFSKTGRKVVNHVHSSFVFENGKIVTHNDSFPFHKWSRQALGAVGMLLGWTSFLQKKVQTEAMKGLEKSMSK